MRCPAKTDKGTITLNLFYDTVEIKSKIFFHCSAISQVAQQRYVSVLDNSVIQKKMFLAFLEKIEAYKLYTYTPTYIPIYKCQIFLHDRPVSCQIFLHDMGLSCSFFLHDAFCLA